MDSKKLENETISNYLCKEPPLAESAHSKIRHLNKNKKQNRNVCLNRATQMIFLLIRKIA